MGGLLPAERRGTVLIAIYVIASLLLLSVGDYLPQSTLRGIGAALFAPLDRVALGVDRMLAAWRENQHLHMRLTELELENVRLRSLDAENRALREELHLPGYHGPSLRPAEVLALSGDPIPASATISAGSRLGVRPGDAAVTSEGLVGRIDEVYRDYSRVVLLTDPHAAVACEVESTSVHGSLRFVPTPHPRLVLTLVPFADTVMVGQRVLTSDMSRRYPRRIPVGQVVRLGVAEGGLTQEVEIRPAAYLTRLRTVFVIPGPESPVEKP
jgi:rod shape-determining protein MreC